MEFGRKPDRQRLVTAARLLLLVHMRFQRLDLIRCQPPGQPRDDKTLKPEPYIERVARFLPGRRRDRGTAIAPQLDQPLGCKAAERAAHDGAAGAEALADRVLWKLRAGRQRL